MKVTALFILLVLCGLPVWAADETPVEIIANIVQRYAVPTIDLDATTACTTAKDISISVKLPHQQERPLPGSMDFSLLGAFAQLPEMPADGVRKGNQLSIPLKELTDYRFLQQDTLTGSPENITVRRTWKVTGALSGECTIHIQSPDKWKLTISLPNNLTKAADFSLPPNTTTDAGRTFCWADNIDLSAGVTITFPVSFNGDVPAAYYPRLTLSQVQSPPVINSSTVQSTKAVMNLPAMILNIQAKEQFRYTTTWLRHIEITLAELTTPEAQKLAHPVTKITIARLQYGSGDVWNAFHAGPQRLVSFAGEYLNCVGEMPAMTAAELHRRCQAKQELLTLVYIFFDQDLALSPDERSALREYLDNGGFLFLDSHPEESMRTIIQHELAAILPDSQLLTLSFAHPITKFLFSLQSTCTGENFAANRTNYGIAHQGRLVLFYTMGNFAHMFAYHSANEIQYITGQYQMAANVLAYAATRGDKTALPALQPAKK